MPIAKAPVALKTRFTQLPGTRSGSSILTTSRYALVRSGTGRPLLIDEQSGTRRSITLPTGCVPQTISNTQAMLACPGHQWLLYDLVSGQTTPFTINPTLSCAVLDEPGTDCASVIGLGSDWATILRPIGDTHDQDVFDYQNLRTGQVVAQGVDTSLQVNLDAATLTAPVCSPLRVPLFNDGEAVAIGSLTPVGHGFQLAVAGGRPNLLRCGSSLRVPLRGTNATSASQGAVDQFRSPPSNGHGIVWGAGGNRKPGLIRGILIPSLRQFTIKPPANARRISEIGLTGKHIYLSSGSKVWSAPTPTG